MSTTFRGRIGALDGGVHVHEGPFYAGPWRSRNILRPEDAAVLLAVGPDVFDDAVNPRVATEFLNNPRHHLVAAIDRGVVVGFASAVHYVQSDKRSPEMWINEVGVATTHRGQRRGKGYPAAPPGRCSSNRVRRSVGSAQNRQE